MEHILKTYRFKLKLTKPQQRKVDRWINVCRLIYNIALETRQYAYYAHKKHIGRFELSRQITDLRKEFKWIKDVPRGSLTDLLRRQQGAYEAFFKGGGFPKWAKKNRYNSIWFQYFKTDTHNRIKLAKLGSVKYFASCEIKGEWRQAVIKKENGDYFITITTKQERKTIDRPNDSQVGVDMGIAFFASLSTGEKIENPRFFETRYRELRLAQRSLSRKKWGSNGWHRDKLKVANLYGKIDRCRRDFIHNVSHRLVNMNSAIAIEYLNVSAMILHPSIGRHIRRAAWDTFFEQLEYKMDWYGGRLLRVNPRYTSQTCSDCGVVDKKSRISQDKFVCTECGAESDADVNAAKVILDRALSNVRKREPLGCALSNNRH